MAFRDGVPGRRFEMDDRVADLREARHQPVLHVVRDLVGASSRVSAAIQMCRSRNTKSREPRVRIAWQPSTSGRRITTAAHLVFGDDDVIAQDL